MSTLYTSENSGLRAAAGAALAVVLACAFGCGGNASEPQQAAAAMSGAEMSAASPVAGMSVKPSAGTSSSGSSAATSNVPGAATAQSGARASGMTNNTAAGSGGVAAMVAGAPGASSGAGASAAGAGGAAATAQAGALGAAAGSGGAAPAGVALPKVTNTDGPGPFKAMVDLRSGPKGQSGLFRPDTLGKDGLLHPVFVWGCGGQSTPSSYMSELSEIATHGFVVIAEVSEIGDNGKPLLAAADWIVAENERSDSPLFHKLNTSRIGLGGHSIGSVNSFIAAPDPRWTTTLHVAGGSLDNVNDPSAPTTGKGGKSLIHPAAYICSESDIFGNVEKTEKDWENTTVPVFFTIMAGTEHIGAVGEGLPVIIAWLRWQLGDENERRGDFLDPQGMFATGRYSTRTKNW